MRMNPESSLNPQDHHSPSFPCDADVSSQPMIADHSLVFPSPPTIQQILAADCHSGITIDENGNNQGPHTRCAVSLSVIIPAYNEESRLFEYLLRVIEYFDKRGASYEVIVVDDGSTDRTIGVVADIQQDNPQVQLVRVMPNRGKGNAVREGMRVAQGGLVLFTDADGATPIDQFERLQDLVTNGTCQMAIGSRQETVGTEVQASPWRRFVGRLFNAAVTNLLFSGIHDTQCGFKLFTSNAAKFLCSQQRSDGFSFDVELILIAKRAGISISEVPVNWSDKEGSKVNVWRDSISMLLDLFRFRFLHQAVKPNSFQLFEQHSTIKE